MGRIPHRSGLRVRRSFRALAAFGALLAFATGCSADGSGPTAAQGATGARSPGTTDDAPDAALPSPTAPYATPTPADSPPSDAPPGAQILYELEARVLAEAATPGQTSGRCDDRISGGRDQTVHCVVRYDDQSVTFAVAVSGDSTIFSYRATQQKAVITRRGVRAAFADYAYGADAGIGGPVPGSVRCDASLPERGLVDFATVTRYACSYRVEGAAHPTVSRVTISDHGPQF
ncbi:MAG: hypothetical protein WCA46_16280 [Actinocatenispora sp.]